MKKKQKPLSFSMCQENHDYIAAESSIKHRSRSHWMDDLVTHLRLKKEAPSAQVVVAKNPTKNKRFIPPIVEEVQEYCDSRCNNVDAQNFVDHYTGNGWMRGKNKIKDWKACVRTWEKNNQVKAQSKTSGNLSACEDFINE